MAPRVAAIMGAPHQQNLPEPPLRRAAAAYARSDFAEAERLCAALATADADCFEAVYLLAVLASQRGDHAEALSRYDQSLKLRPRFAEAHDNRGLLLAEMGRHAEALASHDAAIALAPRQAGTWFNRGVALQNLGRPAEALASYREALAIAPDHTGALNNRGAVLGTLGRHAEAVASCDAALAILPNCFESHCNRANSLNAMRRHGEALASFEAALALRPDSAEVLNGCALALHEEGRLEEALVSLDAALAHNPDFAEALNNRGRTLTDLRRFEAALASYARAQALKPDYARAHHNEAFCRLVIGDFARGFVKNEWRWQTEAFRGLRRAFDRPLWLGEGDVACRTVLVHAEQGLGDTIAFCRYVPLLAERGARVVLEVQPALKRLLGGLPGAARVLGRGEPLPDFDLHCPIMSLPLAFGTTVATIPAPAPLGPLPAGIVSAWRARLGARQRPRLGIAWAGNPQHGNDRRRSIPLAAMAPLFALPVDLVSLQKQVRPLDALFLSRHAGRIAHLGDELTDFLDTAALLSAVDAVLCVDTSVAHLAATLGRATFILLADAPDWRWLLDRPDSPWYPSVRLVRQDRRGDWAGAIDRACAAIADCLAENLLP